MDGVKSNLFCANDIINRIIIKNHLMKINANGICYYLKCFRLRLPFSNNGK